MTKPWKGTGLSDFNSWWPTDTSRGLVYRGDVDMEFMDSHERITVLEFKQAGENLGRAQFMWLKTRARQPKTEVRVVRELPGEIPGDPDRYVVVWNPLETWQHRETMKLQDFRAWAESRAYRTMKGNS